MAVSIPKLGSAMVYGYNYDQLNRITAMYAYKGIGSTSNTFTTPTAALPQYRENVTYDANGNIKTYKRNGDAARLSMDDMTYTYKANTNQLDKVVDAALDASDADYPKYNDIKKKQPGGSTNGQATGNYTYDAIGNLTSDISESISNISWTVYGKISKIEKSDGKPTIYYTYDASGNRITKQIGDGGPTTYYVRDASGNVMSVYDVKPITGPVAADAATATVKQSEIHLYGSSRLGIYNIGRDINTLTTAVHSTIVTTFTRGNKFFELSNHLGNVLVTISYKKIGIDQNTDGTIDYYNADVITASD